MFKDYYEILDIPFGVNSTEIKAAYRRQSLKWHPDKHPNEDVKSIMQDINEAYAVLKDHIQKERYDQEYNNYIHFKEKQKENKTNNERQHQNQDSYTVKDVRVQKDMESAREYAKKLVDEFFQEFMKNSKVAVKGAWEGVKGYVYAALAIPFIFALIRACVNM